MAETKTTGTVSRSKIHHYLNMSSSEEPQWERMGKGWSQMNENPNAQTESVRYICDDADTTNTTGYTPNYAFTADLMSKQETVKKVYEICQDRKTYDECLVDMLKVLAFEAESDEGTVTAYREQAAVAVSSIDGTNKMTLSGNFNVQGDPVKGKFDLKTKTFTPDQASKAV